MNNAVNGGAVFGAPRDQTPYEEPVSAEFENAWPEPSMPSNMSYGHTASSNAARTAVPGDGRSSVMPRDGHAIPPNNDYTVSNTDRRSPGGSPIVSSSNGVSATPAMGETLAQRRRDTIKRCTDETKRLGRQLLFGMTTSLMLQSVPLPPDCDLDPSVLHTVSSSRNKRTRSRSFTLASHVWKHASLGNSVRVNQRVYALDLFHTWAQLAVHMSLSSLVVLGDAIITAVSKQPSLSRGRDTAAIHRDLVMFASGLASCNGKTACVRAAALIVPNVDSPKESEGRLSICSHGVPVPVSNYMVPDVNFKSGVPITLDMAWPEYRVAIEYDGDHHRTDRKQWSRDQEKRNLLHSRKWIVFVITYANLVDDTARAELAFNVARQLALRGAIFDFRVVAMAMEELADKVLRERRG